MGFRNYVGPTVFRKEIRMDAVLERITNDDDPELKVIPQDADDRPTRAEAEAAVRTLIKWAGDDPAV